MSKKFRPKRLWEKLFVPICKVCGGVYSKEEMRSFKKGEKYTLSFHGYDDEVRILEFEALENFSICDYCIDDIDELPCIKTIKETWEKEAIIDETKLGEEDV